MGGGPAGMLIRHALPGMEEKRRGHLLAAIGLFACTGCVAQPPLEPVVSQATVNAVPGQPDCREYTATVTLEGGPQQVVGHACRQPDGSWKITEGPPAQPG